jgi:hypothetical protein
MPLGLASDVQSDPFGVPVERDAIRSLVQLVQLPEVLELDSAEALDVEQSEGDLIFSVGLRKDVLEVRPVAQTYVTFVRAVGDAE